MIKLFIFSLISLCFHSQNLKNDTIDLNEVIFRNDIAYVNEKPYSGIVFSDINCFWEYFNYVDGNLKESNGYYYGNYFLNKQFIGNQKNETVYHFNGNKISEGTYINYLKNGNWKYYRNNKVSEEGLYRDGNKISQWKYYNTILYDEIDFGNSEQPIIMHYKGIPTKVNFIVLNTKKEKFNKYNPMRCVNDTLNTLLYYKENEIFNGLAIKKMNNDTIETYSISDGYIVLKEKQFGQYIEQWLYEKDGEIKYLKFFNKNILVKGTYSERLKILDWIYYDKNKEVEKIEFYDPNSGNIQYQEFYSEGLITNKNFYNSEGFIERKSEFIYQNKLLKRKYIYNESRLLKEIHYDDFGVQTEEIDYRSDEEKKKERDEFFKKNNLEKVFK